MMKNKQEIIELIDFDYLLQFTFYSKMLKKYKYFTKKDFVRGLARQLKQEECNFIYFKYKDNMNARELANMFLRDYSPTSEFVKKYFIKDLISNIKRLSDDIVFLEFSLNTRRIDIGRVNGNSYSYEIKTTRDKLVRAVEQTKEFMRVFEYNFLIIGEDIDLELFDKRIGIIKSEAKDNTLTFKQIRKAKKINNLDSYKQLTLLRKVDLERLNNSFNLWREYDKEKAIHLLYENLTTKEINSNFKLALKEKYRANWKSNYSKYCLSY